ncbi:MAG: hypothetical protein A2Y39_00825 [Candidatus Delongbacteria bacterium GWF2_40_14]|nr:MAG: hypothetical protein A2Y39_00825 [Candidatus Delongbacteria bacterium GWF2_40_14]
MKILQNTNYMKHMIKTLFSLIIFGLLSVISVYYLIQTIYRITALPILGIVNILSKVIVNLKNGVK